MHKIPNRLYRKLENRKLDHSLRRLSLTTELVDFCSNDYLGFSRSKELYNQISEKLDQLEIKSNGATGSRLISGNNSLIQHLETKMTHVFQGESALFFNSGYTANQSVLSAIPQRGDTIIYDELVHASIKDGLRLSFANKTSFKHNDVKNLERKLKASSNDKYVVVESIYSMDGDICPLKDLVDICSQYNAYLIVDEAHSVGVVGNSGQGLCIELGVEEDVFARVYTFGKALGVHGACVIGSQLLIDYLINFSRPFIYTTALPPHSIIAVSFALDYLKKSKEAKLQLNQNIIYFKQKINNREKALQANNMRIMESNTPIQGVIVPGNAAVRRKAEQLQKNGLDVRPILSPTVKVDSERLRICLHAFNTFEEIDLLIDKVTEV